MTLEEISAELRTADAVPVLALRAAVPHADALAPEIYALADTFCRGIYLMPEQDKLLFHGLHVLAAARHAGLYPCLVKLLRQSKNDLDDLFPDHGSLSLAQLLLSVWDGDADAIFQAIEYADLPELSKWALFDVLARLTFDGRISRERTAAFLSRFESVALADDDDIAWWAWENAVTRLGLVDLEDAVQRVWLKSAYTHVAYREKEVSLAELHQAAADPTDPAPFVSAGIMPVDDPAEALSWLTRRAEAVAEWQRERQAKSGVPREDADPGRDVRLTPDEVNWLEGFLISAQVPITTMPLESLDGLFTALIIGPVAVPVLDALASVWGTDDGKGPDWDSSAQAAYVTELLVRHWNAIAARRAAGGPIDPAIEQAVNEKVRGDMWVDGFEYGILQHEEAWAPIFEHRRASELVFTVFDLSTDIPDENTKPVTAHQRTQILAQLPILLQRIADFWKDPQAVAQPARSTKVGRNDPCICGSGKKYKKCCGGTTVH